MSLTNTERMTNAARADAVRETMPYVVPRGWDSTETPTSDDVTPCTISMDVPQDDGMTEGERSIMAEFWLGSDAVDTRTMPTDDYVAIGKPFTDDARRNRWDVIDTSVETPITPMPTDPTAVMTPEDWQALKDYTDEMRRHDDMIDAGY